MFPLRIGQQGYFYPPPNKECLQNDFILKGFKLICLIVGGKGMGRASIISERREKIMNDN